jgi:hypothetical protein
MKTGGGHQKGSSFERELCKQFSLWISHGERDDVFWRTAGSGARATQRLKQNKQTCNSDGDICCLNAEYAWFTDKIRVEIRRGYNHWRISEIFKTKISNNGLWAYWLNLEKECQEIGKIPLLCWKPDRKPLIFFFPFPFGPNLMQDHPVGSKMTVLHEALPRTVFIDTEFFSENPAEIWRYTKDIK